ncbi:MAG: 7-beta-(4-carbaxybutanamido)cephalosporanic acid acylase [Armatimonadota bacterium]|nr:MAG: 7-beta-(4-carbaxybutanamido)cephalosporanic acid acylase [Armatimonadota bacterium]
MRFAFLTVFVGLLLFASACFAEKVTIYRDEWGVPHIYAQTEEGVAYGLGWAQAEDRLEQLLKNYRLAAGTMAEVFGEQWIEHDWQQRFVGHEEVSRRRYRELPAKIRSVIEAYQQGVKDYMKRHPEQVPAWAPKIEPWQVVALGRYIIFNWPMGRAVAELQRRGEVNLPFSSNEWAVRPERTVEGCAILLIDPHIPWDNEFRFYEFRAHGGQLHVSGFGPLGAPLLGLGHNRYLGWAATTGGPDTTDIYVEEVNPNNPLQYRYEGKWRNMTVRKVRINVAGKPPVEREIHYTHHGPIILREGNRAYAVATPYMNEVGFVVQLYRMATARNLREFQQAMAMNHFMEQNIMYADVEGNIFYVRTGRVPIRPKGYDFSKPVPGNTRATEWLGIHPMKDLVQLLNPSRGYMQNCNIGPDNMLVGSPLTADKYPEYIYGTRPNENNSRGRRAVELLENTPRMTLSQAIAIALDTHADMAEQWKEALAQAAERSTDKEAVTNLQPAISLLKRWDGFMNADSAGATLFRFWREAIKRFSPPIDPEAVRTRKPLTAEQADALIKALAAAVEEVQKRYGRLEVSWGEIHRVRRGGKSWPISGGETGGGQTLRAVGSRMEADNIFYGYTGQNWTQVVLFRKGAVESYSANPYGQSDHPTSPHYTDQAEKLFSKSRLKPTWFEREWLEGHIESSTVLEWR